MFRAPRSRGFTLIEMLVSLALFSIVMVVTTAVLLSVVDADHKAQGLKTAIDNLSLSLDSIVRNVRTGTNYHPAGVACNDQGQGGMTGISFTDHNGVATYYQLYGSAPDTAIGISKFNGTSFPPFAPLTGSEVSIDRLCFYFQGTSPLDQIQPSVLMTVGGYALGASGQQQKTLSRFDLETLVSQRQLDVPRI